MKVSVWYNLQQGILLARLREYINVNYSVKHEQHHVNDGLDSNPTQLSIQNFLSLLKQKLIFHQSCETKAGKLRFKASDD